MKKLHTLADFTELQQYRNSAEASWVAFIKKYSDQLSTTALVRRNATKNLENSCFILN